MMDLANIEMVGERLPERAPSEGGASLALRPRFDQDAIVMEPVEQIADGAQFHVSLKDHADHVGFRRVDHQLPILDVMAERRIAAHPPALALGGRDLVPDPFGGDLPLELGEGEHDMEHQPSHAGLG